MASSESNLLNGRLLLLLHVKDVERSVAFYRDKLGFTFKGWWDDQTNSYVPEWTQPHKPGFSELTAGDLIVHVHINDESNNVKAGSAIFHLEVTDVDQYHKEVVARGLNADAPQDMPWGWRQYYVTDPDGYRWSFRNPTTEGMVRD
ncbi:hypothetical protein GWO43_18350 [candidate division KSB1 bacterium]|nr:hypothetical protein [candidate division KSB1 bacterium]NIR69568.1 hypothetical protein [candidate division KSB1 bacterium]NIS25916.1 hypothetical protein [candidate division KSB1 bacterium]NIT72797.1 hypothetical protein [candidate division KSB1 bacterium]NIU26604.1 hypothetical protein [candidate division KSB1 bacterium]